MLIAIILGNRLNDDGSMTETLYKRLQLTKEVIEKYHPYKLILSGGLANNKANITEADSMFDYLISEGIEKDNLIIENKSLTTVENAKYSLPIAIKEKATDIMIVSTIEHFNKVKYNVVDIFQNELLNIVNEKIENYRLLIYTN